MADQNVKIHLIEMKIITMEFSKSLIVNLYLKLRNSKWRIQYGGPKCKNLLDWDENYNWGVFEVADYEFSIDILNMADQNVKNWFGWKWVLGSVLSLNEDWKINFMTVDFYTVHGHKHLSKRLLSLSTHKYLSKLSPALAGQFGFTAPERARHFKFWNFD